MNVLLHERLDALGGSMGWKFGNQTVKAAISRDDNRRLSKSVRQIGGTVRAHAVGCYVNDHDGIIILFDEPVNGGRGIHLGGFHGFVKSRRSRDKLSEVLISLGFGSHKDWVTRELNSAYGDKVIWFVKDGSTRELPPGEI